MSLVNVEFSNVEVTGQGCSIIQRSHTGCGVIVKPQIWGGPGSLWDDHNSLLFP